MVRAGGRRQALTPIFDTITTLEKASKTLDSLRYKRRQESSAASLTSCIKHHGPGGRHRRPQPVPSLAPNLPSRCWTVCPQQRLLAQYPIEIRHDVPNSQRSTSWAAQDPFVAVVVQPFASSAAPDPPSPSSPTHPASSFKVQLEPSRPSSSLSRPLSTGSSACSVDQGAQPLGSGFRARQLRPRRRTGRSALASSPTMGRRRERKHRLFELPGYESLLGG